MSGEADLNQARMDLQNLILLVHSGEDPAMPMASDLMKFLLGGATPEQEDWCLDALVHSPSLRQEFNQLQDRLAAEPEMDLIKDPSLGSIVLTVVRDALGSLGAGREFPSNVWRSVGQEWRRLLNAPRLAHARGGDDLIGVKGTELKVQMKADVLEGNLLVEFDFGSVELTEPATFAVRDPGGTLLPLWHGRIKQGPLSLQFDGIGKKLGFDDGPLPNAIFSISLIESFPDQGGFIDMRTPDGQSVTLRLAEKVSIHAGTLRVAVDVSAINRSKPRPVQLLMQLGSVEVLLGVSTLQESQQILTFEAEIPQIQSLEIWGTSLLKLQAAE